MSILICRIHNTKFGCEFPAGDQGDMAARLASQECPMCLCAELEQLREQRDKLLVQRDALLAAIEIKREHLVAKL